MKNPSISDPQSNKIPQPGTLDNTIQGTGIQISTPIFDQPSDIQQAELITTGPGPTMNVISINPPRSMIYRKLYLWIFTTASVAADNFIRAELVCKNNRSVVQRFPIAAGISQAAPSVVPRSLLCAVNNGGNAGIDTQTLIVSAPSGAQPASVLMQPLYIHGEMDEVSLNLIEQVNVTAVRLFLACISSNSSI